jgi:hypothetical protein
MSAVRTPLTWWCSCFMDGRLLQASCKMCMFSEARIVRRATETRIHDAAFQTTVTELVSLINKLSALKIQSTASWVVSEIPIRIRQHKSRRLHRSAFKNTKGWQDKFLDSFLPTRRVDDNITMDLQETDYENHTSWFITSCSTRHLAQA